MKHLISKLNKNHKGMAMIIVLTVAFVVLISVGTAAAIIANNLNRSGGQAARGNVDNNLSLAMENLRGMYKINNNLLRGCQSSEAGECLDLVKGACIACSDPNAVYNQGDVKYKILLNKILQPDGLNVGFTDLVVTGYYKNISKEKNIRMCLNYCGNNGFDCGDNGCGGSCGTCSEPMKCKDNKCAVSGTVPSAPTGLAAAYNNMVRAITLTWRAPAIGIGEPPITNYKIYHGTTSNGETYINIVGNVLEYVDTKNVKTGWHYYEVTAVNEFGESVYSNEASVNVK